MITSNKSKEPIMRTKAWTWLRLSVGFALLAVWVAAPASVGATTLTFTGVPPRKYASYTEGGMVFTDFEIATGGKFDILSTGRGEQFIHKVGGFTGGVAFQMEDGSPFTLVSLIGGGGGNFSVLFSGFDVHGIRHNIGVLGGIPAPFKFPQPDWSEIIQVQMHVTAFITGGAGDIGHLVFEPSPSAVPEPTTILFVASGLAGLAARAWSRHRKR